MYDMDIARELCQEMGIPWIEGQNYATLNGSPIDPDDIFEVFSQPAVEPNLTLDMLNYNFTVNRTGAVAA